MRIKGVRATEPVRVSIILDGRGRLQAAGVIRGDLREGARLLVAIHDPLEAFLAEAPAAVRRGGGAQGPQQGSEAGG
jgi:hypothetical protein